MKNIKNRVLSGVLAGALAVSMAVPAFAQSTEIDAAYAAPNIEVTVPTTGEAVINPYGMPVEIATGKSIVGAQIVTKPLAIINNGTTDLKVSATVTTETKGDLRIATSKPSSSDTTKSAYVYLQMANSELDKNNVTSGTLAAADLATAFEAWEQRAYASSTDLLLSTTAAATKANMLVLKASDASGDAQKGSIGLYRLAGQVVTSPREAWTADDGFTATVAFTFAPDFTTAAIDKATASVTASAGANNTANLEVSLTGATIVSVEWESDDTDKATVAANATDDTKATVTGAGTGSANVTATITASNGLTYEVTCVVTVTA